MHRFVHRRMHMSLLVHPAIWIVRAIRIRPAIWIVRAIRIRPAIWIVRAVHIRPAVSIGQHVIRVPSVRGGCRASAEQPGKQTHNLPHICSYSNVEYDALH